MTLNEIWAISDVNSLIIELSDYISEKCDYGDNMDALSGPERVFYITQQLEMEVNNGGFSQFFYNSAGDFSGELAACFHAIGAPRTAAICENALNAFGREVPADRDERQDMMDELESDELDEALEACDDDFYAYEEDLNALNYAYVLKHKSDFT